MAKGNSPTMLMPLLGFLLIPYAAADFNPYFENTPNFFSPFDTWRKSFPPSPDGSTQFWPNFHNFEPDFRHAEGGLFSSEERTEVPNDSGNHEPFDVDVIALDVPRDDTSFLLQQTIPFFKNHPFFSTFGSFGTSKRREPWWKGPNICTEREEDIEEPEKSEAESVEDANSDVEVVNKPLSLFGGVQFSVNSCIEKHHKRVCKQVFSQNGRKKTLTVIHQCCHGFGRPRNADITTACEMIVIKSITQTAEEMGAKEFIRSAKNNGLEEKLLSNITLFLPTDVAFTDFSEQMFENNLVVLPISRQRRQTSDPSGITTKELALNHMVDGWTNMEDVKNEDILKTNFENSTIRINLFPRPPNSREYEYPFRYTANCAPIVKINRVATNGLIHVVDKVLPPVTKSVMEIIKDRNDMAVFKTILEKTKLNELLESEKPITVFAPTDKAFEKLDLNLRKTLKEGSGCAANILKNHMLDLTFCSVAVVPGAKTTAYNLLGQAMGFERANLDDDKMQGTEVADLTGIQDILVNGQARVIESDIMGTNGVVHVVDTIMPTDSALPVSSLLEKKNLTIFSKLVEVAGQEEMLDGQTNATFFIPTDKAFEGSIWKQKLQENPDGIDKKELSDFLAYHVAQPKIKTCDLSEQMLSSMDGSPLRINLYSTHALFSNVMNRATVNCARLVHFDDESCGGAVLHQVDKTLTRPMKNLLQILESSPDYSMFLELVEAANLTELLQNPSESLTLLIPKNDVFREVEDWFRSLSDKPADLEHLIKSHIVNDVVCCAGIIPTNWPFVRTIETINHSQLRISRDRRPKIENAGVTKCDIVGSNGILHEINDVINARKPHNPQHHHHIESFDDIFL